MDSILTSIKKLLGIEEDYTQFDSDITIFINTYIGSLTQLNVGPPEGFVVKDKSDTWENFIGTRKDLESIKSFIYLSVRLIFDPPSNSFLVDAIKEQLKELTFRIFITVDPTTESEPMPE